MSRSILIVLISFIIVFDSFAQNSKLKPGFSKSEYIELLKISARQGDTPWYHTDAPPPNNFHFKYRSPELGLANRWDLWLSNDSVGVISIRGTVSQTQSWAENVYAVMVPASGTLKLSNNFVFKYNLSDNPKAAIHTGWLIGTAFLSRDIVEKLIYYYKNGVKDYYIIAHSQGGGIAYILTSYLAQLKREKIIPADVNFKTYCSAAPKPGNLFYAYSFERLTYGGWAFNAVNTADWVPEMPPSVQTVDDVNELSPFNDIKGTLQNLGFSKKIVFNYLYKRLIKHPSKAQKIYSNIFGKKLYPYIKKALPEFEEPIYSNSMDYVRTGVTIPLYADSLYYNKFKDNKKHIFAHHLFSTYIYLTERLP